MRCDKSACDCCGTDISQKDATIFLLFVDLIVSALCVFLFVTTYFCNPSSHEELNENSWFLYAFFIWHAAKLVIVCLGIVGSMKSIPSYLIPYVCYWGLLTAFLLIYSLFVVVLSIAKLKDNENHRADLHHGNETSTSYPIPTHEIFEPTSVPHFVLEYSLNHVALIAIIVVIIAVLCGYLTSVIYGFHTSLKKESQKPDSQVPVQPEVTDLPPEP